ncbi:MAG: site-specific DNA-methyltransferase [bacterium]|nr:site-specific DNA-methyltransferase [bacterium]
MPNTSNKSRIKLDPKNARLHNDKNKSQIKKSLEDLGAGRSIVIDNEDYVIAGNGVFEQAENLGIKTKIIETDGSELVVIKRTDLNYKDTKRRNLAIADNTTGETSEWNFEELTSDEIEAWGIEVLEEENGTTSNSDEASIKLQDKFIIPPFSILDTRQGYWQDRKRYWKQSIGDNGESREESMGIFNLNYKKEKNIKTGFKSVGQSVSILDPVLAEISNLWFGLPKCKTFDCFAGDSVFGYVSDSVGNTFTGIELRQEQADLNNKRLKGSKSKYICDDGQNVLKHIKKDSQDLLFSCPPYFDLEVYSDLKNDASNQKEYEDFLKILDNAFTDAIKCLKNNRFAVITVGDVRNKQGFYYRFVDDIKDIFKKSKIFLWNELILIEQIGTKALMAEKTTHTRKISKVHQNVLVFYKGDPKQIKNIYPELDFSELKEDNESENV